MTEACQGRSASEPFDPAVVAGGPDDRPETSHSSWAILPMRASVLVVARGVPGQAVEPRSVGAARGFTVLGLPLAHGRQRRDKLVVERQRPLAVMALRLLDADLVVPDLAQISAHHRSCGSS